MDTPWLLMNGVMIGGTLVQRERLDCTRLRAVVTESILVGLRQRALAPTTAAFRLLAAPTPRSR